MMKTIQQLFLFMLVAAGLTACSTDSDTSEKMPNYVALDAAGATRMTEDDSNGLDINVLLAYGVDHDITINLKLEGDDKEAVKLSTTQVTFKAKEKKATVKLLSNQANVLVAQEVVYVKVASASEENVKPLTAEGLAFTVKPNAQVPELTAEQQKLIAGYKANLGIDLTKVLGMVSVKTIITFGNTDKDPENGGKDNRTFEGNTIITLSEQATAEKPVLKMLSNPLGMESFMYEKLLRCTTEEPDGNFVGDPINAALLAIVDYDKNKETFGAVLDGITLNQDGTLNFTAAIKDEYDADITIVPFSYTYSVWERLTEMGKAGKTAKVNEGENTVEYPVQELIDTYKPFFPSKYLGNSDIATDAYDNTPSNYIAPAAKYDFNKGTMTFDFAWDYGAGGVLTDYVRVNVTYTMHK